MIKILQNMGHRWISPKSFYQLSGKLLSWLLVITLLLLAYGLIDGLMIAPADYQQGNAFRIIYIHVPAAFMSLAIYSVMTMCAFLYCVWRIKIADCIIQASASLGASFTAIALVTGSIWGKPMWGTWWIWDARLTSELILLFLYFGVIALRSAITEPRRAAYAVAIFILVGFIDIPLIHYSVTWWNTLHQGPTLSKFSAPSMDSAMLWPLLAMIAAFFTYYCLLMLHRVRTFLLKQSYQTSWLQDVIMCEKFKLAPKG